jgi:hypothetical protein
LSGKSDSISIGTQVVEVGASKTLRLGVFFGLPKHMVCPFLTAEGKGMQLICSTFFLYIQIVMQSMWSKGVNFGLDLGLKGKFGFELLFLNEYIDVDYKQRCAPIEYAPSSVSRFAKDTINAAGRFLLLPVNPACVRGFAVSVVLGTGVAKTLDVNFYTAFEEIKYVSLLHWEKNSEQQSSVRSNIMQEIQTQLESYGNQLQQQAQSITSRIAWSSEVASANFSLAHIAHSVKKLEEDLHIIA